MKHALRNFLIYVFSVLGFVLLYRAFKKQNGPLVRVLVFHDVLDRAWFENCLLHIKRQYHVVTPEAFIKGDFHSTRINVLITFDDGYQSWIDVGEPVLAVHQIQALFFINSGLIDSAPNTEDGVRYVKERLLLTPRNILSWDGVQKLAAAGHMIGGHTTTHARLSELQEHMQQKEITEDKARIEMMLDIRIDMFAYPFGQINDFTEVTARVVSDAGYTHTFSTVPGFVDFTDMQALNRLCLDEGMTTGEVARVVEGGYDVFYAMKHICVR